MRLSVLAYHLDRIMQLAGLSNADGTYRKIGQFPPAAHCNVGREATSEATIV